MTDKNNKNIFDLQFIGLAYSSRTRGDFTRLCIESLLLSGLLSINSHIFLGIFSFFILMFIMLRLTIKRRDFDYTKGLHIIKVTPMMNRWYWGDLNGDGSL